MLPGLAKQARALDARREAMGMPETASEVACLRQCIHDLGRVREEIETVTRARADARACVERWRAELVEIGEREARDKERRAARTSAYAEQVAALNR